MSTNAPVQLSLGVSLRDDATFNNYFAAGETNAIALHALQQFAVETAPAQLLIWGARGAGLTHLLQAVCHSAAAANRTIQYLPMADVRGYDPEDMCDGLEEMEIVCLDGVEHICGNRRWEQSIFHLYNRLRDQGRSLLISSHTSPPSMPVLLADLKSRLLGCVIYHIESMTDQDKVNALCMRASVRGFDLPEDVAHFILRRVSRDTVALFHMLNQLDDASLQKKRKLTIPFVKDILCL